MPATQRSFIKQSPSVAHVTVDVHPPINHRDAAIATQHDTRWNDERFAKSPAPKRFHAQQVRIQMHQMNGGGGIRTPETIARLTVFKTVARTTQLASPQALTVPPKPHYTKNDTKASSFRLLSRPGRRYRTRSERASWRWSRRQCRSHRIGKGRRDACACRID